MNLNTEYEGLWKLKSCLEMLVLLDSIIDKEDASDMLELIKYAIVKNGIMKSSEDESQVIFYFDFKHIKFAGENDMKDNDAVLEACDLFVPGQF